MTYPRQEQQETWRFDP